MQTPGKAILNAGLAFCLVLQVSVPCCGAAESLNVNLSTSQNHCHECSHSAPTNPPNSHCDFCAWLAETYALPSCSCDQTTNDLVALKAPEPVPGIDASQPDLVAAFTGQTAFCCDIHEMQTLRE